MAIKLTPAQFLAQWQGAAHKINVGVHNFKVQAGQAAVEIFQESFDEKSFNGNRWAPACYAYPKGGVNFDLMEETGTLRSSIRVRKVDGDGVTIFTDPSKFRGAARHKGFCYAGVHNSLDSLPIKPTRGPKRQRQFIGHTNDLFDELNKLTKTIFARLP